MRMHCRLDAGP